MMNHVSELLPGFALGILDEKDTETVLQHLGGCDICQAELTGYQTVTQSLGMAAPMVEPPAHLKEKVMGRLAVKPSSLTETPAGKKASARQGSFKAFLLSWRPLMALLVLTLFTGNLLLWNRVVQLQSAPPKTNFGLIKMVGTDASTNTSGVIVISPDGQDGTLVVAGMKPLDKDHQYQLWLVKDDVRTSGGVFNVSSGGYGALWVKSDKPLIEYQRFGVTVEPHGGSPGPTGQKVLGSGL